MKQMGIRTQKAPEGFVQYSFSKQQLGSYLMDYGCLAVEV